MENPSEIESTLKMIADYMEKGFLENIIDMFKHDKSLYPFIGTLLDDERMGVRIGITALVETLRSENNDNLFKAVPGIAKLLKAPNATLRGDAAYLLGIIGHKDALPFLSDASHDEHDLVRETVREAMEEIKSGLS